MKPLKGPKRNQPLALTEKSKRTSFDRYVLSVKSAHGGQTKQPLGLKFAQAHKDKAMNRKRKEEEAHKEKVLSEKGKSSRCCGSGPSTGMMPARTFSPRVPTGSTV